MVDFLFKFKYVFHVQVLAVSFIVLFVSTKKRNQMRLFLKMKLSVHSLHFSDSLRILFWGHEPLSNLTIWLSKILFWCVTLWKEARVFLFPMFRLLGCIFRFELWRIIIIWNFSEWMTPCECNGLKNGKSTMRIVIGLHLRHRINIDIGSTLANLACLLTLWSAFVPQSLMMIICIWCLISRTLIISITIFLNYLVVEGNNSAHFVYHSIITLGSMTIIQSLNFGVTNQKILSDWILYPFLCT